jgi:tetratricopeptide (TPR) repeat protein
MAVSPLIGIHGASVAYSMDELQTRLGKFISPPGKTSWLKVAKIGSIALGIPSLVGFIGFGVFNYFYPQKVQNFLSRRKEFSKPPIFVPRRRHPYPIDNRQVNSQFIKGEKLIAQGKNLEAQAIFTQLLKKETLNSTQRSLAWNRLGKLYTDIQQTQKALKAFQQSIKANPNLSENYVDYAVLLQNQGDSVAALESVKKALVITPQNVKARSIEKKLRQRIASGKDKVK